MDFTALIDTLLNSGVLGVTTLVLGWAYWHERRRVAEQYEARLIDAREKLELAKQVFTIIEQLSDTFNHRKEK